MLDKIRPTAMAAVLLFICSAPAFAQGPMLEQYDAFLGSEDHFNSRGARLTEPWQIIRQDRANFHRFGMRDTGDQGDAFFASAANRARMEQLIRNGRIDAGAATRIINGNVWIRVEIYENAVNVVVQ